MLCYTMPRPSASFHPMRNTCAVFRSVVEASAHLCVLKPLDDRNRYCACEFGVAARLDTYHGSEAAASVASHSRRRRHLGQAARRLSLLLNLSAPPCCECRGQIKNADPRHSPGDRRAGKEYVI
jgi:hypothetical protein